MKKLLDLFQTERFTDILSWVIVIALGIGIVVFLDSLDIEKKDKYLVGKGIKWLLILMPWLCLKLYNLFKKKEDDDVCEEATLKESPMEYEEQYESGHDDAKEDKQTQQLQQPQEMYEDKPLEKPKESTLSIVLTSIIVGAIIFIGSWLILTNCTSHLNELEKRLVGAWSCIGEGESEETTDDYRRTYLYDNTFEYQDDGTLLQTTLCNERLYVEEDDYNNIVTFKWEIVARGSWNIEKDILTEDIKECDITLKEIRTAVKKDNDIEYISKLKAMLEDEIPEWRNSMLGKSENQIVRLIGDNFVGNDGDAEYKMKRIQ